MKLSRRGWNNVLMLGIIAFMVVLNLPTIIKENFLEPEQSGYPYLLNPSADIEQIHFSKWSLVREESGWQTSKVISVSPLELVQRWQSLVGTEIDETTFEQLKPQLSKANSIEIWYLDIEEPQRVTYYQTPKYWLMKNWQQKWIAISVDAEYLFPLQSK